MSDIVFADRTEAGRVLAGKLANYSGNANAIVLALPRGGVPVAREIAAHLRIPLDIFIVRKLGVPGNEELAFGAVAEGGAHYLDRRIVATLGIPDSVIQRTIAQQQEEIARRQKLYRGNHKAPEVAGKTVILVDDGIATGSTVRAAIQALKIHKPRRLVLAVPVAPADTCDAMKKLVDELVCLEQPEAFFAVGQWYRDFRQVSDDEVRETLAEEWSFH